MGLCAGCGSRRGCRCALTGTGLAVVTGLGSGTSPYQVSVTCADVKACVADMFSDIGFDYDPDTGKLVVPSDVPAGAVLTSNGDGTASWVSPPE